MGGGSNLIPPNEHLPKLDWENPELSTYDEFDHMVVVFVKQAYCSWGTFIGFYDRDTDAVVERNEWQVEVVHQRFNVPGRLIGQYHWKTHVTQGSILVLENVWVPHVRVMVKQLRLVQGRYHSVWEPTLPDPLFCQGEGPTNRWVKIADCNNARIRYEVTYKLCKQQTTEIEQLCRLINQYHQVSVGREPNKLHLSRHPCPVQIPLFQDVKSIVCDPESYQAQPNKLVALYQILEICYNVDKKKWRLQQVVALLINMKRENHVDLKNKTLRDLAPIINDLLTKTEPDRIFAQSIAYLNNWDVDSVLKALLILREKWKAEKQGIETQGGEIQAIWDQMTSKRILSDVWAEIQKMEKSDVRVSEVNSEQENKENESQSEEEPTPSTSYGGRWEDIPLLPGEAPLRRGCIRPRPTGARPKELSQASKKSKSKAYKAPMAYDIFR